MERSRTIGWEDPVAAAARAASMSGLEYLGAIRRGELPPPPIAALMDMELAELDRGRAVFAVTPAEFHYNPIGSVHGGVAATLLDSAMGCAVHSTLPAGVGFSTLELKINYTRPMTRDTGRVLCEARVVHRGETVATTEGRVFAEGTGKLLAHGSGTCLLFSVNGGGAV
jgi:uncharacterized protein (TIGR00369 family)